LIQGYLSVEGYNLAHDGSGYQSILSMWNAADAIVWYLADFTKAPYYTIPGGMGRLTDKLHDNVVTLSKHSNSTPAPTKLGWELLKVSLKTPDNKPRFRLEFGGEFIPRTVVSAEKVILALPQPALKRLSLEGLHVLPGENDVEARATFDGLLDSVTANPLCKLFLIYDKPWWNNEVQPSCFKIFTDLPLRQVYHFGTERQCVPTLNDRTSCCLLLAYSDARYADYWKQLDKMSSSENRYYSESLQSSMPADKWDAFQQTTLHYYGTGDTLVAGLKDQLAKVITTFVKMDIPPPDTVLLKHWSDPPFYVGWHSWNVGAKSWRVAERLVQPFDKAPLFTCGEAFSSEQGWIEGALKSAERVLEKLGVAAPSWVNAQKYQKQKELWL